MITPWRVRLELARDDGGPVGEDGVRELTRRLTESGVSPVLSTGDAGAVLVEMRVQGKDDRSARNAAEARLREGAQEVWTALHLPPFTIVFVQARPDAGPATN